MSDLISAATEMRSMETQLQYQARVVKKIQDMQELEGRAAVQLIEAAMPRVADATGQLGTNLDVVV